MTPIIICLAYSSQDASGAVNRKCVAMLWANTWALFFQPRYLLTLRYTGSIKNMPNWLLVVPFCDLSMDVQKTITGLHFYWRKFKNVMIFRFKFWTHMERLSSTISKWLYGRFSTMYIGDNDIPTKSKLNLPEKYVYYVCVFRFNGIMTPRRSPIFDASN